MKRLISVLMIIALMPCLCACDSYDYKAGLQAMDKGYYDTASEYFENLGDYEDSAELLTECRYMLAKKSLDDGNYDEAIEAFSSLGDYEDSEDMVKEAKASKLNEILARYSTWICEYDDSAYIKEVLGNSYYKYAVE